MQVLHPSDRHTSRAQRWLALASALALLGAASSAQSHASGKIFARYNKPLRSISLDLDTGTLTRGPKVTNRKGTTVTDFDNNDLGGFVGVDTGNGFCKWIDAAIKGTGAGLTAGTNNNSDLLCCFTFAYCSARLTPGSGGPGGTLALSFYEGYTLFGGAPTTGVANFSLSGLPGNTASSSFFGGFNCFFLKVFFAQLICCADGPIGYGFKFLDQGTGTLNPLGAVLAGTWPFLSCTDSCSAVVLQTDLQGMTDAIDEYCPPSTLLATFTFGTTSGSYTSISMGIEEVADQTATITVNPGIPAAPDLLRSNSAVVGASWSASVTSGFARTKAGSWTLFFGDSGVALPTGFDIGQFPKGGGNFGTNKAGRRLLCNINAANPSGCAAIPLAAGLGNSSSCHAVIPKEIGLVCNVWCGQAIVVGGLPAGCGGGGNSRLTNSIGGVLGTNGSSSVPLPAPPPPSSTGSAPVAQFVGCPLSGSSPLTVNFTNQSTGSITSHAWTFGDGGTSTVASPSHTYTAAGTYTVALTETGPGGSNTLTRMNYITVSAGGAPVAEFVGSPLSGALPLTVNFTNQSTGSITSHAWTFGDGGTATVTSPSHIYTGVGTYTVALTETGPGGSSTRTRTDYITVFGATVVEPGSESCPATVPMANLCNTCGANGDEVTLYAFSGESISSTVDMRIPGRGFDMVIARKYRSRISPSTAQGSGWDFSYNISLEAMGPNLLLHDGNSRGDTYPLQPDGSWAQQEFFRSITRAMDGSFTLTFPDTGRWHFLSLAHPTASGRIDSITDRNGNTMTFAYDGQGRLSVIYDTLHTIGRPRPTTLGYDGNGRIASITDFTGRQTQYSYYSNGDVGGSDGDLKSVTTPAVTGTPNGNDFPFGKTTTYTYSKGFADQRLNHNLLTITDPKGQTFLTNVYASTQDPSDLEYDRVMRQIHGNPGDIIDYVYLPQNPSAANNFATQKTIENDRVGNVTECFYDGRNRKVMVRQFTGRAPDPDSPTTNTVNRPVSPLRPTDPAFYETRYEYNGDSLVTRVVHPNLNEELFTYDETNLDQRARGNLLQHCWLPGPLGGDQAQICESFEYDTGFGGCCGTNFVVRQVDGLGNETLHQYNAQGNRIHTTHRIPAVVEDWEYNATGQITAHILPDNGSAHRRRDEYTYYASGPQTGFLKDQIVDAPGFAMTTSFEYDSLGRRVRVIDPRGNDSFVIYNALNQVVRERSREVTPGGVRYERDLFYDENDNLARIDVQNVDEQQQVVGSNPYLTTIYDFDVLNRVSRACQEKGSYAVPASQLTCAGLPNSEFIATEYAYDANRNRTLARLGEATNGNQPYNVVATLYDERNLVFRETRGAGSTAQSTTEFDYDENGNLESTREGLEEQPHVSTTEYDGFDRSVSKTDAMGNVEAYHYDANCNRTSIRVDGELVDLPGGAGNQRLSEVMYTYDALDRRIVIDTAFFDTSTGASIGDGHAIRQLSYSANSQAIQVTNDNGHATLTAYDSANRLATTSDANGNTIDQAYDDNSNVVRSMSIERSDLGSPDETFVTARIYDNLDRLTSAVDNVGNTTQFLYDSRSNSVRSIDAMGEETRFVYDGADRMVQTIRDMNGNGATGDVADIVTGQTWDDSSRLVGRMDDNGNTTVARFDALNRSIGEQYADGTTQMFSLDVHGSTIQSTDANGSVVNSTYDALDRVLHKAIVPGPGVSNDTTFEAFQYDGLSRLVRAEDEDSVVTRGHDSMSNVTRETLNGRTTTCVYDGEGNELSSVYPGGRTVTCTYDALERKDTISDQRGMIADYSYQGTGRVERRDYGNGTRTSYVYDGVLNSANDFGVKQIVRTTHSVIAGGAILDDRTYTWDALGNKTRRADVRAGGPMLVHDYAYDAADRMVQSVKGPPGGPGGTITYALDGVGNRTLVAGGPNPGAYTSSGVLPVPGDAQMNQYTTTPEGGRSYDGDGNLKSARRGGIQFRLLYDYRDQLVAIEPKESTLGSGKGRSVMDCRYSYDALGRRIAKSWRAHRLESSLPHSRYFIYKDLQIIEERGSTNDVKATYVYGKYMDNVISMRSQDVDYYYHEDESYSVTAITDSDGLVVERYEYDDYGTPWITEESGVHRRMSQVGNPFAFTGREYDVESSLYYYRTRYEDPSVGRFIARDRLGSWEDLGGLGNGLSFVGNNPSSNLDPTGLYQSPDYGHAWNNCSKDEKKTIDTALGKAESLVSDALDHLGKVRASGKWCDKRTWMYFGQYTSDRLGKIISTYGNIQDTLKNTTLKFRCKNKDKDYIARTFPGADSMSLAQGFFDKQYDDTWRGGVLVHELSHQTSLTGDYAYGDAALALGPFWAVRNADNYEFFAENRTYLPGNVGTFNYGETYTGCHKGRFETWGGKLWGTYLELGNFAVTVTGLGALTRSECSP